MQRTRNRVPAADGFTLLHGPVPARLFLDRGTVTDAFIDSVVPQWLTTLRHSGGPSS
ncbi:hypothetical protein ABZ646_21970 [Streptomyces sp. NPDC007162]|uniref:hypothetical protein n=1 Tax=Streptomyces sp. NPDC007162 TaxID=3156917 RepID=UPI0033DC0A59